MEFMGIAKAMLETGILPDFIVVDGKEGGTGAAPLEFTDHIGVPLREGLLFVHNTLVGLNLRDKIKVGASGKIVSAFRYRQRPGHRRGLGQLGARLHVRHRLHPVAELPYQQVPDRSRHPGPAAPARAGGAGQRPSGCATSIATPSRAWPRCSPRRAWNIPRSSRPSTWCDASPTPRSACSRSCTFLQPGELLSGKIEGEFYERMWNMARADSFDAAA